MANEWLVLTGSLCLILALLEAWLLVALSLNPGGALGGWFPGTQDVVKSHIDYLLMSMLLFIFYLLFGHFQITAPALIIAAMCLGAIGNPLLFLARAAKPSWKENPALGFRLVMTVSCLLATAGYAGGAWLAAKAAIAIM